jgi:O-antigen/teichoic acid export membrane protein
MINLRSILSTRFRGPALTMADQAMVSLLNFTSIVLLARYLSLHTFGHFALAQAVLLLITGLQQSYLGTAYQVEGARHRGRRLRAYTTVVFGAQVALSSVLALAFLTVAGIMAAAGSHDWIEVAALGVSILPWLAQDLQRKVFYTRQRPGAALLNDLVCYGLQLVAVTWLVTRVETPTAWEAVAILGGSSAVAAAVGYLQLRGLLWPGILRSQRVIRSVMTEVWAFGKWLVHANIWRQLGSSGNIWIVAILLGPAALGAYRAVAHLLNAFNPIVLATSLYLPPAVSRLYAGEGASGLRRWYRRIAPLLLLPLAAGALTFLFFGQEILDLAYGDRFVGTRMHWVLAALGLSRVIAFGRNLYHDGVVAAGQPQAAVVDSLITIGATVVVGIPAVYLMGIYGVPVSSLVISAATLAYNRYRFQALPERPPPAHSPYGRHLASGKEGSVFVDDESGVATKVYHNASFLSDAERYFESLQATHELGRNYGVHAPRPYSLDRTVPLIRMEACPGVHLDKFVCGPAFDAREAGALATRIWLGVQGLTKAIGTASYDLWGPNTLYDADTARLTFIDLESGNDFAEIRTENDDLRSAAGFVGHALYHMCGPAAAVNPSRNRPVRTFMAEVARVVLSDFPGEGSTIRQGALVVFRDCTKHGGPMRRFYYQTCGRLLFEWFAAGIFASHPGPSPPDVLPEEVRPASHAGRVARPGKRFRQALPGRRIGA